MGLYRDEAVVLRTHKLGEADRIVSVVTERHGKVRAVAKGVRRTKSKFGARLEPFSHVDLQLYAGRSHPELAEQFAALGGEGVVLRRGVWMGAVGGGPVGWFGGGGLF